MTGKRRENQIEKEPSLFENLPSEDEKEFEAPNDDFLEIDRITSELENDVEEIEAKVILPPAKKRPQNALNLSEEENTETSDETIVSQVKNEFDFLAQKSLIERAFATDNVVQKFMEEKEEEDEEEESEAPLPGWNCWAGKGILPKPTKQKKIERKKSPNHVIINEKTNKQQLKYTVTKIPFPFTSNEQYERKMMLPVGKEWNATTAFQKNIKPSVLVKVGRVIDPITFKKNKS